MPPKKSNLNNQRSRHARRARAQRQTTSTNQTMAANATERFASGEMDTREVSLRWNDHHITMISVFEKLLENSSLVDCTIAAEGQYLKAHKVVLSACSPYFELLFSQENEKNPIVVLKDVKFQELKDIIDFIYRGKVKVPEHRLGVFVEVAESLQIKGLASEPKKHLQNSDERSKDSPGTHRKTHCSSSITSKRRRNNDIGVIEGNKSDLVQMSDANDNRNNSHRNVHSPSLLQQALLTASSSSQPEITSPFNADEFTPSEETEDLLKADTPFAPLFQAPETPTKSLQQTVSSAVKTELEPIAQIFLPETENVDDPSNGIFIEESTVMTEKEDIGEPVSKPDDQSASQYSGRRRRRPSAWAAAQTGWVAPAPAQTAAPVWTPPPPASLKTKQQQQLQQQAAGAPAAGGRRRGRASAADRTCPVCGRVMAVPSQLTRHLRVHTGERPYRCKMCGQSFTQSSSLRVHQRLHTGERPFGCGLCDRRFYRASNLRAHMRSHTGERPYACDVCGRRFAHGGERLRHERLAHGAPPPTPRLRRAALHPAAPAPEDDPPALAVDPALDADASPGGAGEDGESDVAFALW